MRVVAPSFAEGPGFRTYSAYGLRLRSAVPLPATVRRDGIADAEVRRAALAEVTAAMRASGAWTRVAASETHLHLPGIGTFLVRDGHEILVEPDAEACDDLVQLAIVGPVFATLLQQRGWLVLHASAVEMNGTAVGFLGGRGAGKSTTAAALRGGGHLPLADDVVAVRFRRGVPWVVPGFPMLKLWPDAVVALGGDPALLPELHPSYSKRAERINSRCARKGVPLACLYVLSAGDRVRIESLSPREAFVQLVAHSYGIEWLHGVSGASQFEQRAALVRHIPVRRLRRPRDLALLPELIRRLEADRAAA